MWTSYRSRRSRSNFNEPVINRGGWDQVSVNQPWTKTAEIKFQWARHRPRQSRSNFSEPAFNQGCRDQISVNQSSTKVEIKVQWTSRRVRRSRSNFSELPINQGSRDQVKCEPVIDRDGRDQVSVNQPSIKTVEIKFRWMSHRLTRSRSSSVGTSHQPRRPRSSFNEPD